MDASTDPCTFITFLIVFFLLNSSFTLNCSCSFSQQGTCMYKSSCNSADVVKFNDIPTGNEMALQQAVATVGPVSVAIDAALSSFHMYHSGET